MKWTPMLLLVLAACAAEVEAPLPARPDLAATNPLAHERFGLAYARLESAANATPDVEARALGELGMLFHAYQRFSAALVLYERALSRSPGDPEWLYYRGQVLEKEGRYEEAALAFREVARLEPSNPALLVYLARSLDRAGRLDEASAAFERLLELEPDNSEAQAYLARREIARGEVEVAVSRLEAARERAPRSRILAFVLGQAYAAQGRSTLAEPLLEAASAHSIDPGLRAVRDPRMQRLADLVDGPLIHERRGLAALERGEYFLGMAELRQALALDPARLALRHNLAIAQMKLGRRKEAMATLNENLEHDDFVPTLILLAALVEEDGQVAQADELLDRAETADPASPLVQVGRAQIERARGRTASAASRLERALRLDPASAVGWFELVATYLQAGDPAQAGEALARFGAAVPDDPRLVALDLRRAALGGSSGECRKAADGLPTEGSLSVSEVESLALAAGCAEAWSRAAELQAAVVGVLEPGTRQCGIAERRLDRYRSHGRVPPVWEAGERWVQDPVDSPSWPHAAARGRSG